MYQTDLMTRRKIGEARDAHRCGFSTAGPPCSAPRATLDERIFSSNYLKREHVAAVRVSCCGYQLAFCRRNSRLCIQFEMCSAVFEQEWQVGL